MMMKLLADATLPELAIAFQKPFDLTLYHDLNELQDALPKHTHLLCRSTLKVNASLLNGHHLDTILTASSGRDHLDEGYLKQQQTNILDAKGSNADAVVDYVLACLATLVCHHHMILSSIGIIGYGAVGSRLYQRLQSLGFRVLTCDPIHPGPNATDLNTLAGCDVVCIHANLHQTAPYSSLHLLDVAWIKKRKSHQVILNAARGSIVDEAALLQCHKGIYCTDVYEDEPHLNPAILQHATLCTPHIAGHTIEAKKDAVRQLSMQFHQQLGLPCPQFPAHERPTTFCHGGTWMETVLLQYNPSAETALLKSSHTAEATFLTLRKKHHRHALIYP